MILEKDYDWEKISKTQKLSELFIREFKNKVDWVTISDGQELSESFPYSDPVAPTLGTDYFLDMSWDKSRTPTAGPAGCGQPGVTSCHTDLTGTDTSLSTWEGIKLEHDRIGTPASNTLKDGQQGCYTCHYNDSRIET